MNSAKAELRTHVNATLRALSSEDISRRSSEIHKRLFATTFWREAKSIYCFVSLSREVQTAEIRSTSLSHGKLLALPRVVGDELQFHVVERDDQPLERSSLGIYEPPQELPHAEPSEHAPVLVVVPGIAFDPSCYRLGRGRGYYDRFLGRYRSSLFALGVCFEEQLVEAVPRDDRDVRLDAVLTEQRVLYRRRFS